MSWQATILGCGSSGGVPRVAQGWGVCDPTNPKNRRRRCSLLVQRTQENQSTNLLIDTSPDLREQLLGEEIHHLDGIVLTHAHADHTHGIDDVRPLVIEMHKRIDLAMDEVTSESIRPRFSYIFQSPPDSSYPPLLNERRIETGKKWHFDGAGGAVEGMCFRLNHGDMDALGVRIGGLAYTPDLNDIPPESLDYLHHLDVWIIDALRYTSHPSHLSVEEALRWIAHFKPKRAILTNLNNDLDFETLRSELPPHVEPAFDGMQIRF